MKTDKSNMRKVILDFPGQFKEPLKLSKQIKGKFDNVIVCAMGGSSLGANILTDWLNYSNISSPPIYIHRSYNLPPQAGNKSLVIAISYSGNTEETISSLKEAVKRKIKTAAVSTGGIIEKTALKHNIPFVKIPASGIQPRSATGYLFNALIKILIDSKIIENKSKDILSLSKKLKRGDQEKKAKILAKKLKGKIPVIYSSNRLKCLARIWKIKFNENSKTPAFYNYFPELNHNEMVGFSRTKGKFHIIILRDKEDHPRIKKRMELLPQLINIESDFVDIKEGDPLFKIFSTIVLGDWVSYYLALEYKINPTPVELVEKLKDKLRE